MKPLVSKKELNEVPEPPKGQWIGVNFLLPGYKMKAVRVRLSKRGERCQFLPALYIPRTATWVNRERKTIEVDGWEVSQWFLPEKPNCKP